jgi:hypothetical protein
MSTALTTHHAAGSLAVATQAEPSFDSLVSMGDALRRTGFLPSHIKDGVSFAAIVLMGRELGMGTMAACRKLQVIKGTVTERADSQLARFKSCGGRAQFKELSEGKAVLWLKHPNGDEHTETFTIEDAKRAGLASNDNYAKHPKAMLRSRAITAGLKSIGWEGAVGIYDPDEIAVSEAPAEPVIVRPRLEPGIEPTALQKARHAIQKARSLDDCNRLRDLIRERHSQGVFTDAEHDDLTDLLKGKAEIIIGEDAGQEFEHEAAATEATA